MTGQATVLELKPEGWTDDALCRQFPWEMFYPEKGGDVNAAKSVCQACPVRRQCARFALETEYTTDTYPYGIFGGLSRTERTAILRAGWKPGDRVPGMQIVARGGMGTPERMAS